MQPTTCKTKVYSSFQQLPNNIYLIFREIAEAYEVLRDPVKRRQYESMGHDSFHANTGFKPGSTDFKDLFKDFEDLFKEFGPMEDFFKQHFAAHKIQTEAHGGIFNFATDIR